MNRNNRLYTLDADGKKQFTAAGLLLQFWILLEGGGQILNSDERRMARRVVNNVMDAWQAITDAPLTHRQPISGISEDAPALGADRVFEIIYPLQSASVH